jgi:bla regulator protein blaR1
MNLASLSSLAPAIGNHLWQSTVFAFAVAVLTLILRNNRARDRYWLWLIASLKFLIPFSPLVAIGTYLARWRGPDTSSADFSLVVEQISQPFTPSTASASHNLQPAFLPNASPFLAAALAAIWLGGFIAVLALWFTNWRRLSIALRNSVPLLEGREIEALRRQERVAGIRQRVEMLLSRATLEPGIFGMTRPVLVWPEGISQHLETAHLDAIVAHELWHVRRRDNLAAALHMVVEAIFWFHPLVWWLGARLVEERERACDEEVVGLGGERRIYAESILKVCEFCVGSPLACVSGVTGSDLKKRMVHIMSEHVAKKLDFTRKLLLTVAGFLAIAVPVVFGLMHATPGRAQSQAETAGAAPTFQSFSIKPSAGVAAPRPNPLTGSTLGSSPHMQMMYGPDSFVANNVTLQALIQEAYGVLGNQISGPSDLLSATYDVAAKADPSSGMKFGPGHGNGPGQLALQAALAEHAKLIVHHDTKVLPIYALVVGEGGPKIQPSQSSELAGDQKKIGMRMLLKGGSGQDSTVEAHGVPIADLARQLSMQFGVAVVDKTGLKGLYNFNLHWAQNLNQPSDSEPAAADNSVTPEPSLVTAIQQQLGLKLEPQTQPMDIIVIDHIEQPATDQSENFMPVR